MNTHSNMHADLVIVGAGMVGSALALALKDAGLNIVLVDGAAIEAKAFALDAPFEPRVSALSAASQRILQRLGAWSEIAARRSCPYTQMYVWEGEGTAHVHFTASSVHAQNLGHIVENRVVQDALYAQLQDSSIQCLSHARLEQMRYSGDGWRLELSTGQSLLTQLVIAADGANSIVRKLQGSATREWDYLHHAIVTSVRCAKAHQGTAWQRFTGNGPLAFLPLERGDGQHWCSIVWSTTPEHAQALMGLDEKAFNQQLAEAFEYQLGEIEHSDARYCIPLRQRHAKRYVQQGLALVGDAAHTIHPLAGQGVNLGFLDVAALAQVLLDAHNRGERLADERVLSRYERRRMPHNLSMMAAMQGFERLFQAKAPVLRWLRNQGLKLVQDSAAAKGVFMRQALGLSGDLPDLAKPFNEA